ncbi:MAG: hypothetical protein ABH879_11035 [archaeon]
MNRHGYEVSLDPDDRPSRLAGSGAGIIYIDSAYEIGSPPGMDGHNLAIEIRKQNRHIPIGLLDLTDEVMADDVAGFLRQREQYDLTVTKYLTKCGGFHAIQGRPSTDVLATIVNATLAGRPVQESYINTRVVLP